MNQQLHKSMGKQSWPSLWHCISQHPYFSLKSSFSNLNVRMRGNSWMTMVWCPIINLKRNIISSNILVTCKISCLVVHIINFSHLFLWISKKNLVSFMTTYRYWTNLAHIYYSNISFQGLKSWVSVMIQWYK